MLVLFTCCKFPIYFWISSILETIRRGGIIQKVLVISVGVDLGVMVIALGR
jgi:hypothetical protein